MSLLQNFRWAFLSYLVLPFVVLFFQISALSWRYEWLTLFMSDCVEVSVFAMLGVAFSPCGPVRTMLLLLVLRLVQLLVLLLVLLLMMLLTMLLLSLVLTSLLQRPGGPAARFRPLPPPDTDDVQGVVAAAAATDGGPGQEPHQIPLIREFSADPTGALGRARRRTERERRAGGFSQGSQPGAPNRSAAERENGRPFSIRFGRRNRG